MGERLMPRYQDIQARYSEPRQLTSAGVSVSTGSQKADFSTNQAVYSGGATYAGTWVYGPGGWALYDGANTYGDGNVYDPRYDVPPDAAYGLLGYCYDGRSEYGG
jgi:hypothetical protein